MNKWTIIAILSLVLSLFGLSWFYISEKNRVHYGFVNTEKLLAAFSESQKVMIEIREEDARWRKSLQQIQDSLTAFELRMEAEYESASLSRKKELKEEQIKRIEEMGRFEQAQSGRMVNLQNEKLQLIYDKINFTMPDFAKKQGLDLIFASGNGSIVYGEGSTSDVTDEFILFLNERF
ncbi:MAG: OmpH family outer membrane protein [Fibrobacter sp.]|jgi:Skp family chaperone for outer membrane proteins|nr:OmpH family outer membrane protein [Fibrobacter sp.]